VTEKGEFSMTTLSATNRPAVNPYAELLGTAPVQGARADQPLQCWGSLLIEGAYCVLTPDGDLYTVRFVDGGDVICTCADFARKGKCHHCWFACTNRREADALKLEMLQQAEEWMLPSEAIEAQCDCYDRFGSALV
jgi:hypothetical protein